MKTGLLFVILFISGCHTAGLVPPKEAIPIRNQENTYLKFKVQNYDRSKEAEGNLLFRFYKDNYQAVIQWYDPDPPTILLLPRSIPYSINPSHNYFKKKEDGQHLNVFWQFVVGDRRNNFRFDCEYWIPLPAGENEFSFMVSDYGSSRRGYLRQKFHLPANHSVRLSITPLQLSDEEEIAWKQSKGWPRILLGNRVFDLQTTIEPNIPGEVDSKCNPFEGEK
ncbi:hypothetical protein EHQ27_03065 [Leptospira wolffii]|uniref:hypothetical protein n=1 Tax=Leptospira wolffii TaxID=409998 RepID=UPI0010842855|nr:hypothetical protein [Leptospira wolffii]TGK64852.1 hypothetical protein EHQ32_01135 [Leptospira wolffii]TGK76749.1 hypothetical protein EHQ35_00080 [Leptospira wolffii]TGK77399.1 hypothetical protein EHQ27_03065 [Leptospira wolffii]TGL26794.1 hypothetical protein EHQ57_18970 [Leptospira wolffii]